MSRPSLLATLLVAATVLYFVDLGGSSIWDANEAFYVETPREMIESGDYVSPTFNYEPRLNKPVLSYWIVAGFYQVFGISVGVHRLAIAIGALVIIATAFVLAGAAMPLNAAPTEARLASVAAALGLAVSPRLVMFARRIFIDIYVSMFMGLTLMFFVLAERWPARRRLFLALMYIAVGLGVLTKGPIAAVLPALVFAAYLAVHRELHRVRDMMIPAGILIVIAIVVPWYGALYQRDGWTYISAFILGENVERFTEGYGVNARRGPFFYLPVVFSDAFPISIFLVAAAAGWLADRRRGRHRSDVPARLRSLLWIWVLTIVGFFSLSAAKQDLYIFPIVPAVAALGGVAIARSTAGNRMSPILRASTLVLGGAVVLASGALLYLFTGPGAVYNLAGLVFMAVTGLAAGLVTVVYAIRSRLTPALLSLALGLIVMNWTFIVRVLPSFEAYKPVPGFARALEGRAGPDDVVATYNVALPSLVYYLGRRVQTAYDPAPIRHFLESPRTAYVILSERDYEGIDRLTDVPICTISTQPTFDVKLRNILARDPLPDLLLITNRCG